ncbi:MAG TPA: ABC transporter substrate-binding protein [Pyrinomonadaceae bacterium]|nr:ABC transporter substrate-binding protein [Pyrinomonadaceae bacterium]
MPPLRSLNTSLLLVVIVAAALLFASASCQTPPASNTSNANQAASSPLKEDVVGTRGGSLTYRITSPPKTFNYMLAADEPSNFVAFFLTGARLVELDHDTQTYAPALAESWKLSDDALSVEVTLRDGLKFSDGHALTSEDVAFTLRALYDERVASPIYRDAMLIGDKPITVTVADARHFRLGFPEQIAVPENYMSNLNVLPRHVLEAELGKTEKSEPAANSNAGAAAPPAQSAFNKSYAVTSDPVGIVTAGAFAIESSVPGERVTLKRNPHFWKRDAQGNQLPYLDRLVLEVVTDENNSVARLGQGTIDIIDRVRPTDYASLRGGQGTTRAHDVGPGLYADNFWFNLNPGKRDDGKPIVDPTKLSWFADARFRRAVSHAIDRDSIATNTWQGLATPLYNFVSSGNRAWVAPDVPRTAYDLERARALLREAGFAFRGTEAAPELFDAKGNRVEFTLIAPAGNEVRVKSAIVIQEDLKKLGMNVQVAPVENAQLSARINGSYDYEAVLYGTSATEPDPSSYTDMLRSASPQHFWHPKQTKPATDWEARLDDLTMRQAHEVDRERRRAIFRDVQLLMAEQLPLIPIVTRHIAVAFNTRVGNYRPSPLPPFSLWNAEELFVKQ